MGTLSSMTARLRRFYRLSSEVSEKTGSHAAAIRFAARFLTAKFPIALRQARGLLHRRALVLELELERKAPGERRPIVAVKVSGGFGDYLVVARFLRDLAAVAGGLQFDIFSTDPKRAEWVFGAVDGLRSCYDDLLFDSVLAEYDLALHISQSIAVYDSAVRWRRISQHATFTRAVQSMVRFHAKTQLCVQHQPFLDGLLAQKAVYSNCSRANFLHRMAGIPYGGDTLGIRVSDSAVKRYGLRLREYITIHNGFDPGFIVDGQRASKCYPHFEAVVQSIKKRWPDLRIVQLGTSTSEPIDRVDLNLIGRISLFEAGGIIENAVLHIDNEGGLVHLARCLGVDSCVVFGPTPSAYFGYPGNINIEPTFCGGCWWINETWMSYCPRGFDQPRCMTEQDPRAVASAIDRYLSATLTSQLTHMSGDVHASTGRGPGPVETEPARKEG